MSGYRILQIDAFTHEVFGGNPAGVVPEAEGLSRDRMQLIAREMNVSETAFVACGTDDQHFNVRFFTPTHEVDLCGHATIAAFWLLASEGRISPQVDPVTVYQETAAGCLAVDVYFRGEDPDLVMMSQVPPRIISKPGWDDELETLLGFKLDGRYDDLPRPQVISTGLPDLIVPFPDRDVLWSLSPDYRALAEYCRERSIISVHCFTDDTLTEDALVHCRDFSPAVGVPEEAATGTASGATAAYLGFNGMLCSTGGSTARLSLEQGYILDRPSTIYAEVDFENGLPTDVRVGGQARVVIDGFLVM